MKMSIMNQLLFNKIATIIVAGYVMDFVTMIPSIRIKCLDKRSIKGHEFEVLQALEGEYIEKVNEE